MDLNTTRSFESVIVPTRILSPYCGCRLIPDNKTDVQSSFNEDRWEHEMWDAAEAGQVDQVRYIITRMRDVVTPLDLDTAFMCAARGGNFEVIHVLIEHGVCDFELGLDGAIMGGHINIARSMIEEGLRARHYLDFKERLRNARRYGQRDIAALIRSYMPTF